MPIALLLLVSVVGSTLATIAFSRLAPSQGATASTAHALEMAIDRAARRRAWRNARVDPNVLTGLALTAAVFGTIACGLVIALLAYLVRSSSALHAIDAGAARWGNEQLGPCCVTWRRAHRTYFSLRFVEQSLSDGSELAP